MLMITKLRKIMFHNYYPVATTSNPSIHPSIFPIQGSGWAGTYVSCHRATGSMHRSPVDSRTKSEQQTTIQADLLGWTPTLRMTVV